MSVEHNINVLLKYSIDNNLIDSYDEDYFRNLLSEFFMIPFADKEEVISYDIFSCLKELYALKKEEYSFENFTSKVMDILLPRPSQVKNKFLDILKDDSRKATDYLYSISTKSVYINEENLKKDIKWKTESIYGDLDITINLSKPEKDPKEIAKAKLIKNNINYPKCMLCKENMGYQGRASYPAKHNLRFVPLTLNNEDYFLQYSPYSYFSNHLIVFNKKHIPMVVNKDTFSHLLSFVDMFPHYFLGSNADLPIVGGSILTHDHYQGGDRVLPMFFAEDLFEIDVPSFEDIKVTYLKWPLSVIRLKGKNKERMISLAEKILDSFISFEDKENNIFAFDENGNRHNTITPIASKDKDMFVLDLALRNNYTDEDHPLGLYHPHEEYWCIKKENIGLIEVLGVAILPRRLKDSLQWIIEDIKQHKDISSDERVSMHCSWVKNVDTSDLSSLEDNLKTEIGHTYVKILECCAIFKSEKQARESVLKIINNIR